MKTVTNRPHLTPLLASLLAVVSLQAIEPLATPAAKQPSVLERFSTPPAPHHSPAQKAPFVTASRFVTRRPVRVRKVVAERRINFTMTTEDGLARKAILTLRPNAKGNVVLCHPAAHDKNFLLPFEEHMFAHYNCLRFDFRRHGEESDQQYATLGKHELYEVASAVATLKKHPHTRGLPIYGFGISMGASILIESERAHGFFDGLVLQAPFDSLRSQIRRSIGFFNIPLMDAFIFTPPVRMYAQYRYRIKLYNVKPVESIKKINKPIFLIHAQDDPTISMKAFHRLKQAGKSIVRTWTPEKGRHTELFKHRPDEYTKEVNEFLDSLRTAPFHYS